MGKKCAEHVKQINGTEEAIPGRKMLEMFRSRALGKVFST